MRCGRVRSLTTPTPSRLAYMTPPGVRTSSPAKLRDTRTGFPLDTETENEKTVGYNSMLADPTADC